jgi:hypothetical protein
MKVDSLDELESAFAEWRRGKKHAREAMPEELRARARRATKKHGEKAVVRVTRVERARLFRSKPARKKVRGATRKATKGATRTVPAFSRFELGALPAANPRPIAEVETGTGMRLRVFEETPEMMALLSAACGLGGVR